MATLASTVPSFRPQTAGTDGASFAALGGRLMVAPIFLLSGVGKIADPTMYLGYIQAFGMPLPALALAGSIAVEILGGLALLLGYRTRLTGGLLAVFSVTTALVFHSNFADNNEFLHFWKNLAMAGGLLQIAAFGGGQLSLDRRSR